MKIDEPPAITVKYDNMSLPSALPLDQVADRIPDWVHNVTGLLCSKTMWGYSNKCDGTSSETYMEIAKAHWLYILLIK